MRGELFGPILTTDDLLAATSDERWLQAMLDVEAALAAVEAELGLVPADAATAIAAACRADGYDVAALGRAARAGGNPAIPLVDALRRQVPDDAARWVHLGAASQDVVDTAAMLVARDARSLIARDVSGACAAAAVLAEVHRDAPMVGRTLLQQAPPISFGGKVAGWLAGLLDARVSLGRVELAVQLGGPVGTLAGLGEQGPAVAAGLAARLGLAPAALPWHTARQRIAELAAALAIVAGTAAKVTGDVALLMQTEVAEAAEPAEAGRGASSSIPGKRNPVLAAEAAAAARRCAALVPVALGALMAEHERPVGAWHAEWEVLIELLVLAGGAAANVRTVLEGLEVDTATMASRVEPGPDLGSSSVWIDRVLARFREEG